MEAGNVLPHAGSYLIPCFLAMRAMSYSLASSPAIELPPPAAGWDSSQHP